LFESAWERVMWCFVRANTWKNIWCLEEVWI
jgi:hypothetical protein